MKQEFSPSALRKACEDAAKEMWATNSPSCLSESKIADIIERHLTPVFEALRDSVIEEEAKSMDELAKREARRLEELKGFDVPVAIWELHGHRLHAFEDAAMELRALKGAPR